MADGVQITLSGTEEFNRKMLQFDEMVRNEETRRANLETGFQILTDTRENLTRQNVVDTGLTRASYHVESSAQGGGRQYWQGPGRAGSGTVSAGEGETVDGWLNEPMRDPNDVHVGSKTWGALIAEYGRAPGKKQPPPGALADWLRRHGLPESIEYVVARKIAEEGIPPKPSLIPAVEANRANHQKNLARAVQRAAERVSE